MTEVIISGTGLFTPPNSITNDELVDAYNRYVTFYNDQHATDIESGICDALPHSSSEFIIKASGIKHRYVMNKEGMLDLERMRPIIPESDELEVVTMGLAAAKDALEEAAISAEDIDLIIVATTNHQRAYPSIAVEIQNKLGCTGYAYDMGIACSSATFGLISGVNAIKAGAARNVLVVNPEYASPQVDMKSRDSHFIFGDVATATVLQDASQLPEPKGFKILHTAQETRFSENIKCMGNYTDHCIDNAREDRPFFQQEGRKVFKELLPLVTSFIEKQLSHNDLSPEDLTRYWLHQANINMNEFAIKKLLGRRASHQEAPVVLDEYANTASSGSIVAFHKYKNDLSAGNKGLICSFGAGYSIGSLIVEKC